MSVLHTHPQFDLFKFFFFFYRNTQPGESSARTHTQLPGEKKNLPEQKKNQQQQQIEAPRSGTKKKKKTPHFLSFCPFFLFFRLFQGQKIIVN